MLQLLREDYNAYVFLTVTDSTAHSCDIVKCIWCVIVFHDISCVSTPGCR